MTAATVAGEARKPSAYNFAYLDEQTKRMIRRAILKAVAILVAALAIRTFR